MTEASEVRSEYSSEEENCRSSCTKCCNPARKKRAAASLSYLKEWSDSTTLHGISYIGEEGRHPIERICWVIAVVLCAGWCCTQIAVLWSRWQTSPVIVSLAERSTAIWDIPFPAITLCPENKIRRSMFNIAEEQARRSANNETNSTINYETSAMVCSKVRATSGLNRSHLERLEMLSPTLGDSLQDCEWGLPLFFWDEDVNKTIDNDNPCLNMFRKLTTDEGICFTFNMLEDDDFFTDNALKFRSFLNESSKHNSTWDPETGYWMKEDIMSSYPRRAVTIGPNGGVKTLLRVRVEDLQAECNGDAQTWRLSVHSVSEFPLVSSQFVRLPLDSSVSVAVRPDIITTAPKLREHSYNAPVRGCYFPNERKLSYFKIYTQQNCEIECAVKFIRQECFCHPFFMATKADDDLLYCAEDHVECMRMVDGLLHAFEAEVAQETGEVGGQQSLCQCLPSCSEHKYLLEISHSQFNITNDLRKDVNTSEYRYIELEVFFKDMQFIRSHRSELYGTIDFLANCGGLLGLFTGFSVITAVEICYFASLRLACHLRKHKKQRVTESA